MTDLATNVLDHGDNLDIRRRSLPDVAVDRVYLDPPFNSNRDYSVISDVDMALQPCGKDLLADRRECSPDAEVRR